MPAVRNQTVRELHRTLHGLTGIVELLDLLTAVHAGEYQLETVTVPCRRIS